MIKQLIWVTMMSLVLFSCNNRGNILKESVPSAAEVMDDNTSMYLFVGTYTGGDSKGIYVYQLDTVSGNSQYISMVEVDNPSYLTVSKDEKYVYAVTENEDNTSAANAFSFDKKTGNLTKINTQLTEGGAPCYITIDDTGKHVVTANYLGASISVFNTESNGALTTVRQVIKFQGKGLEKDRQTQPHLHCVQFSPDEKYLYANDLGTDKMHLFDVTPKAKNYLKPANPLSLKVADGAGPRHLVFHPSNKYAYIITELSGAVIAFDYNNGLLKQMQSIQADTLGAKGSGDIQITPDGRFLYASNRVKGDGLAIFSINETDGKLTKVGYQDTGIHPRNFVITPNGKFVLVANRDSNSIQVFVLNQETGLLTDMHKDIELSMPVCLKFASMQ